MFSTYLQLGFDHILDLNGFDHILYVITLCASFPFSQWKKLIILVTAFTLGHSITLALAGLNIVVLSSDFIEFLIPCTILFTALVNLIIKEKLVSKLALKISYPLAAFFGLIHGFGFSNFFRALLGKSESLVQPLLAFNLGVELGQLLIVAAFLVFSYLLQTFLKVKYFSLKIFISGLSVGISLILIRDAIFW